ncbi:MAG TPA: isoaspartyl peptidase/L-asparaginase [Chitinophagaceae bacterium]|nr:isoaspartyl peptidase/L-asparaginase [Chitinophagaceae bacterium]
MKSLIVSVVMALFCFSVSAQSFPKEQEKVVMVIHGGAGTILRSQMSPEREKAYQDALREALTRGYNILKNGGSALDANEAAIRYMEDSPLFNAGKGAVFTNEGKNELDAAVMDGSTLKAGSVAGLTTVKNPITLARAVMEKSPHVMMIGGGAEKFAKEQGLEIVDPSYFRTEDRWRGLQRAKREDSLKAVEGKTGRVLQPENKDYKYGTVGAVSLDKKGNLAAATSTGGMTNKKYGRVGDVPVIGAGTYANNNTCAISCTGWGEFFIRLVVAKSVSDLIELKGMSVQEAADKLVMKDVPKLGGDGGLIALDKNGKFSMPFCTEGMYRGYVTESGKIVIAIYKD